jgi:hypothetical protein
MCHIVTLYITLPAYLVRHLIWHRVKVVDDEMFTNTTWCVTEYLVHWKGRKGVWNRVVKSSGTRQEETVWGYSSLISLWTSLQASEISSRNEEALTAVRNSLKRIEAQESEQRALYAEGENFNKESQQLLNVSASNIQVSCTFVNMLQDQIVS